MPTTELATRTRLVFALHFHQPFGNLDEVFARATDRCYLRTLELMAEHPHVAAAIHVSGSLLDWTEAHRPAFIDALAALVRRGQIEVLGGGYQEPMLAILPERDAVGQLEVMAERCEQLLGQRPRGMWLTERVWEPDLPRVLAATGHHYTLLDDTHLFAAGAHRPLGDYYVTDKAGDAVAVFPIDYGLRTRIPYAQLDDLLAYLASHKGRAPTYGDDAEKFGVWPTTEKRVWHERWLERFFDALKAEAGWLATTTPSRVMADTPSSGAVYIPTISYQEMGAWALPADKSQELQALARRLELSGHGASAATFLRGGIWQAFVAKYPESNLIYRKMLRVSSAVEAARLRGDASWQGARAALYQGQCNCAYWHGLFGGLYLQHLRSALMGALLEAEALASPRARVTLSLADHDGDLAEELLFEGPALNLYLSPARGGSGLELDLRDARFHLTGVLGRRLEAYHQDVHRARVISDEELGNMSAHDIVRACQEGLADKLIYDAFPRGAFVDHLLPANAEPSMLDRGYAPLAELAHARFEVLDARETQHGAEAELHVEQTGYRLTKRVAMRAREIEVGWRLGSEKKAHRVCFASHIDVTLLSPDTVGGRRIDVTGPAATGSGDPAPGARAVHSLVREVRVLAESLGIDVTIVADPPAELWRLPIETVSQSERGFESSYQGTALVFAWRDEIGDGHTIEPKLTLAVR